MEKATYTRTFPEKNTLNRRATKTAIFQVQFARRSMEKQREISLVGGHASSPTIARYTLPTYSSQDMSLYKKEGKGKKITRHH